MIAPGLTYQPKGSMCASCKFRYDDCHELDFDKMEPISKGDSDGTVIVRCTGFKRDIIYTDKTNKCEESD